jgi:3-oxoacyl-(acyl-carrier-protein) synthase
VLEAPEHARGRQARLYAEIEEHVTFGVPAPLYDWPERAPAAIPWLRRLLASADGCAPAAAVDLVCGSANSSRRLDACELDVLSQLFGEMAAAVSLTSIKGAIGEFGTAGALAAAAVCLALQSGRIPPLCHLRRPPEDVLLQFAPTVASARPLRRSLMFSLARGGAATALLMRRATA